MMARILAPRTDLAEFDLLPRSDRPCLMAVDRPVVSNLERLRHRMGNFGATHWLRKNIEDLDPSPDLVI